MHRGSRPSAKRHASGNVIKARYFSNAKKCRSFRTKSHAIPWRIVECCWVWQVATDLARFWSFQIIHMQSMKTDSLNTLHDSDSMEQSNQVPYCPMIRRCHEARCIIRGISLYRLTRCQGPCIASFPEFIVSACTDTSKRTLPSYSVQHAAHTQQWNIVRRWCSKRQMMSLLWNVTQRVFVENCLICKTVFIGRSINANK